MLNKILILLGVLSLLSGCSISESKSKIIVVDKSINQELVNQETNDQQAFVLTQKTKPVKKPTLNDWSFPVTGKAIKLFSPQHTGITFDTSLDQAVRAVAAGTVIYSGDKIKKYGKMIIIKHPLGFYSIYTQNYNLLVKLGDKVKQREIIALSGKTDFYFEMKKFKTPINPLEYLK